MKTSLNNGIILAEDYNKLVDWYIKTFTLDIKHKVEENYHYTELAQDGHVVLGIARTDEMGVTPTRPRNNSVIIQILVSNIHELYDRIKDSGKILFGPFQDKEGGFTYGGIADPEGNQIWLVQRKNNDK
jgi:predicted enzyme related to lactoylglutathione lyase